MKHLETLALSKAISTKSAGACRDAMTVGRDQKVDFTVRVKGYLDIFEDTEKTPTVSIPMKETLALFIRYCGVTREAAMGLLQRAMTDALAVKESGEQNHKGVGAIAEAMPIIDEIEKTIVEPLLRTLPRTPVKGKVLTYLEVTEVGELLTV